MNRALRESHPLVIIFSLLPGREILVGCFPETEFRVVGTKMVPTAKQLNIVQFVMHGRVASEGQVLESRPAEPLGVVLTKPNDS